MHSSIHPLVHLFIHSLIRSFARSETNDPSGTKGFPAQKLSGFLLGVGLVSWGKSLSLEKFLIFGNVGLS